MFAVSRSSWNKAVSLVLRVSRHRSPKTGFREVVQVPHLQEQLPLTFATVAGSVAKEEADKPYGGNWDTKFEALCKAVVKGDQGLLDDRLVIRGLHRLLKSNTNPESYVLHCFEQRVLWRCRKMRLHNLCYCLSYHVSHQETPLQKKVVETLCEEIQTRVSSIESVNDVVRLLELSDHLGGAKFMLTVQDRALHLMNSFNQHEICFLVESLAKLGLRPTPLLQAAAFYLGKKGGELSLKDAVSLLNAFKTLSFPDLAVLRWVSEAVVSGLGTAEKPSLVAACLTSVGQLRWRHPDLLESCASWILSNASDCRQQDVAACLLALARVQYMPEDSHRLFTLFTEHLCERSLASSAPLVWLDVVWSLATLGRIESHHLDSVFKPEFYKPLLDDKSFAGCTARQKLLNLAAVNDLEFPNRPRFPKAVLDTLIESCMSFEEGPLQRSVKEALANFAPSGKYLLPSPELPYRIPADAEIVVDENLHPVPLESPMQPEHKRVAVVVLDFKDVTLYSSVPTGCNALRLRLLKTMGYAVLEVHHTEYDDKEPVLKKVKYLQRKLQMCVKNVDSL
uniref:RAP domain-containing protein n=1 Tax=Ornithodoros turicata TaxID=34597 RepID=A0A2R5LG26_9ACAR